MPGFLVPLGQGALALGRASLPYINNFFMRQVFPKTAMGLRTGGQRLARLMDDAPRYIKKHPWKAGMLGTGFVPFSNGEDHPEMQPQVNMVIPTYDELLERRKKQEAASSAAVQQGIEQQESTSPSSAPIPQSNPQLSTPIEETHQVQAVPPVDTRSGFEKFVQSEAYQKLQDLLAGMAAAPSGGSGWDALASGLKHLNQGDKERRRVNQTVEYLKSKGYSEEEAIAMARNPQMLSAMLTGGDTPKLLAGHEWYTDPETGKRGQRPMTGTLQELEYNQKLQAQQEWEHKKKRNAFLNKQMLRAGLSDIADAIQLINKGYATGFAGWGSRDIGGTPAYILDRLLDGIRGGVLKTVFENLKSMSVSGNMGVGPISDFESKAMSSMFGSLDVGRDKEGLKKTLHLLETTLGFLSKFDDNKLYNAFTGKHLDTPKEISDQYSVDLSMPQGNYANVPIVKSAKELESIPKGTKVLIYDTNGNAVPIIK